VDLYFGSAVKNTVEPSKDTKKLDVRGDAGAAVGFGNLDLILSFGLPYTPAGELGSELSALWTGGGQEIRRGGISYHISSLRLFYGAGIYCGTLRFAGSLARLKKPCLSSPWNYGSLSLLKPGLAAALPTFTSSDAPAAFAVVLRPAAGLPLPSVEAAATRDGEVYASVHEDLRFPAGRSSALYMAVSGGSFIYGGTESSAWFYKEPFYREHRYLSADAETGFRLEDRMSLNLAAGFSENPFGGLDDSFFWRRGQLAVSFHGLSLAAYHFEAETPGMILPGGSRLNMRSRLSLNPSIKLPTPAGTFSVALLGRRDVKLEDGDERDYFYHGLKGSWRYGRFSVSAQYADSFPERDADGERSHVRKCSLGCSCRWDAFRLSSSFTFKADGDEKALSFSQKLYPASGAVSSVSLGISPVYGAGGLDRLKVSAGAVLSFRSRYGSFQGKLLYSSTFCGEF
jgi:hypothetical protein